MLPEQWSKHITLSIADVEQKHARNRREADPSTSFSNFAALYCNLEAQDIHLARTRMQARDHKHGEGPTQQPHLHDAQRKRAPSAMVLRRNDFIARKKTAHEKINVASAELW